MTGVQTCALPIWSGWSSPFVWKHEQRSELIVIGRQHAIAYALDTGKELWRLRGLTGQSTPSPVAAEGLLYLATGSQGEGNRPVFAVKPGASGDITLAKGEESNAYVAWVHPRASAYTSSPLVYRGRMYVVNDNGILTVFDAKTKRFCGFISFFIASVALLQYKLGHQSEDPK